MKIILLKNVPSLGVIGDVVNVSDGHARNYLIPQKLAAIATPQMIASYQQKKEAAQAQAKEIADMLDAIKKDVEANIFSFSVTVGKDGSVFGSIHKDDIVKELSKFMQKHGVKQEFSKDIIHIDIKPIKELGEHTVEAKIKPAGIDARTWRLNIVVVPAE